MLKYYSDCRNDAACPTYMSKLLLTVEKAVLLYHNIYDINPVYVCCY